MTKRAKQADFVALNLRLPPDLHGKLREAAGTTRSLNAEILERLQRSFETDVPWLTRYRDWRKEFIALAERRAEKELRRLAERIDRLEGKLGEERRQSRRKPMGQALKGSKKD
jgi:hypothetical protein